MNGKWKAIGAAMAGVAFGAIISCQRYDFEPVTPLAVSQRTQNRTVRARLEKPNAMLVFDRSGSLTLPIDSTVPACRAGSTTCGQFADDCPANCMTRDRAIKSSVGSFLTNSGAAARFGMIMFPTGATPATQCQAGPVSVDIPTATDDVTLNSVAGQINSRLQASLPAGGTPTSATLAQLGTYSRLQDPNSPNIYILVTDGVPNCNPSNPHDACRPFQDQTACECTLEGPNACCPCACNPNPPGDCAPGQQPGPPCNPNANVYRQLGCIDRDGTVATMNGLRSRSIFGFVIGVGDETLGNGVTLNAMAEAAGYPRLCPNGTNQECGTSNPCVLATRKCTREYYQAGSASDLAQALDAIRGQLASCTYLLEDIPTDPSLISVIVNNQAIARGPDTWSYDPGPPPKIVFAPNGAICNQINNSSPSNPVTIQIRILQTL